VDKTKLLTVKERAAIRKRNPDNEDIEKLLSEGDELRTLVSKLSEANKYLDKQIEKRKLK